MARSTLEFEVPELEMTLPALWDRPRGATCVYVLAHGAGAGMEHHFMEGITGTLVARKVAVLRYPFPYMHQGRRAPDRAPKLIATVRAAVALGRRRARGLPLFAGGKSMGGRMTSMAMAESVLPVRGLAFLGFPLHPPGKPGVERAAHLAQVRVPMLFLQGSRDKLAALELLEPQLKKLGRRARAYIVDEGDHGFAVPKRTGKTPEDVLDDLANEFAVWAAKHG